MAEHNETVTILTYKRNSKAWLCNECETENHMEYTKCIVCGMNRQVTSRVLETWETARTKPKTVPTPTVTTGGWVNTTAPSSKPAEPEYAPPTYSRGDSTGIKAIICVVIAIIVIIGLVVFLNENFYLF
ncbi:MAG: hypothetical protein IJ316_00705 [Clostridia bacterium]|nr:hypothetical protein [Clostridia bacterium]